MHRFLVVTNHKRITTLSGAKLYSHDFSIFIAIFYSYLINFSNSYLILIVSYNIIQLTIDRFVQKETHTLHVSINQERREWPTKQAELQSYHRIPMYSHFLDLDIKVRINLFLLFSKITNTYNNCILFILDNLLFEFRWET